MTSNQKLQGIQRFVDMIPHCAAFDMQALSVTDELLVMTLPPNEALEGNADDHLVHGGVLTMLMDTSCGAMAVLALPQPESCPTVDLRLDHYRPAVMGAPLFCEARVMRFTDKIVFTEGLIYQERERPVARGIGTFMRMGVERTPKGFAEYLFGQEAGQ
ncbi:hypothetical protein BFW38_04290 [Terasakiispira papahanaumokuakeensis]|uniref:Thioesterase domain-containing protein n=1 Tax=Terasakiispira papahanaumokuakeensis TaxID=197479 RepID=A0A1E2V798_9GAMM|nr:PaaI family thioesterase [Terasakiispira papahanaumokuakeensis]ODC02888.1 hypothetical protein BFW38_04290 [Terasakiispira papahanaumokuakeensis]